MQMAIGFLPPIVKAVINIIIKGRASSPILKLKFVLVVNLRPISIPMHNVRSGMGDVIIDIIASDVDLVRSIEIDNLFSAKDNDAPLIIKFKITQPKHIYKYNNKFRRLLAKFIEKSLDFNLLPIGVSIRKQIDVNALYTFNSSMKSMFIKIAWSILIMYHSDMTEMNQVAAK